jgi:hypothetical protein
MKMRRILFALIMLTLFVGVSSVGQQTEKLGTVCVPKNTPADEIERLRNVLFEALDKALREHTVSLFKVWMADPTDQPSRMLKGMIPAIDAHIDARAELLKWNPPTCEEKK